jgi:hypothetical protein
MRITKRSNTKKRSTTKKNRDNKRNKRVMSRRSLRGGGCAQAGQIVEPKNAMKLKDCQWERTANGKAKLVNPMPVSNNSYY